MNTSDPTERPESVWDFLVPAQYNLKASIQLAYPFMGGVEDK